MAAKFLGEGRRMNYTNGTSAAISSGDVVVITPRIGVAQADIAVGATGALRLCGVCDLDATSADSWSAGATLYWNATTSKLTDTAGANPTAGIAFEDKAALTTTAAVILNGMAGA